MWRITHLSTIEDGTFDLVQQLSKRRVNRFLASVPDCFYCLTIWVAFPSGFCFANKLTIKLLLETAVSRAVGLLQELLGKKQSKIVIQKFVFKKSLKVSEYSLLKHFRYRI